MSSLKEEVLDAISKLPDSATFDDFHYQLYVLEKIKKGREAAEKGETLTIDELRAEVKTW